MFIRSAVIYFRLFHSGGAVEQMCFNRVLKADVAWTSRNVRRIEFQTLGVEHENLRAPFFVLHGGSWSRSRSDDRSDLVGRYGMSLDAR